MFKHNLYFECVAPTSVVTLTLSSCRTFGADLCVPEHHILAFLYLSLCVGVIPTPEEPEGRCCAPFGSHAESHWKSLPAIPNGFESFFKS